MVATGERGRCKKVQAVKGINWNIARSHSLFFTFWFWKLQISLPMYVWCVDFKEGSPTLCSRGTLSPGVWLDHTSNENTTEVMGGSLPRVGHRRPRLLSCQPVLSLAFLLACSGKANNGFELLYAEVAGHSQEGTQILSPPGREELNPAVNHLSEPGSRSTFSWTLQRLQRWPTPWLPSCEIQRSRLSCTQMPDPQKLWDSKWWGFKPLGFGVTVTEKWITNTAWRTLKQGSANFFWKGLDSKYFLVCGPYSLCCSCSALPLLQHKSSHGPWWTNEHGRVLINPSLQQQVMTRPTGCSSPTPALKHRLCRSSIFELKGRWSPFC